MNKKQGFTLAELLGVIIIIGILALLIIPTIDNSIADSKDNLYLAQVNSIEKAAENWAAYNMMKLPENEDDFIIVYLWQLKSGGYIDNEVSDPRNGKLFPNDMEIKITRKNHKYVYELVEGSGTEGNTDIPSIPIITINGDLKVVVGVGQNYVDAGATAIYNGKDISNLIQVTNSVNTNIVGSYEVKYNVTYDGKEAEEIIRTVIVMDKDPVITLTPEKSDKYEKSVIVNVDVTLVGGNTLSSLKYKLDDGSEQYVTNNQIVINTNGEHTLEVTAIDNEGNNATITAGPYKIDRTSPTITFAEGDVGIILSPSEAESFDLKSGVNVTDNRPISINDVIITGQLSSSSGGYDIKYTVTDEAGNVTEKIRSIYIISDDAVARIGNDMYTTLNAAISAVTTSEQTTIVLLKNIELLSAEKISETQNIILDMDGYTISNPVDADVGLFYVYGTLTFDSSNGGTINHTSSNYIAISAVDTGTINVNNGNYISNSNTFSARGGGKLNINGGEISSPTYPVIYNNGGTIVQTGGNVKSSGNNAVYNKSGTYILNGESAYLSADSTNVVSNKGEFIIKKGNVVSNNSITDDNYPILYNQEGATMVIDGGYFESNTDSHLKNLGTFTINGGTFVNEKSEKYLFWNTGNNDLTINGGEFIGSTRILNGSSSDATLTGNLYINGGYFKLYSPTNAIQHYTLGEVVIKNAKFETFDTEVVTYPLIYNYTDNVTIESGTEIISNTRNHIYNKGNGSVTINGGAFTNKSTVTIQNVGSGTVTINDGTFSSAYDIVQNYGNGSSVFVNGGNYTLISSSGRQVFQNGSTSYADNVSNLEVNGGTYHLKYANIVVNHYGNVTVSNIAYDDTDSSSERASNTFYNDYGGNMIINNCQIKTKYANIVENFADGNVTINGGEYEVNDSKFVLNGTGGNIEINADIHVVSHTPPYIDSDTGKEMWYPIILNDDEGGTITINGGSYESNTTAFALNRGDGAFTINDANVVINIPDDSDEEYRTQIFSCEGSSTTIINGGYFENYYGSVFTLKSYLYATEDTKLIIGDSAKSISKTSPKLFSRASDYDIIAYDIGSVTFNNGIMVGDSFYSSSLSLIKRSGATLTNGTETINGVTYKTLYYK